MPRRPRSPIVFQIRFHNQQRFPECTTRASPQGRWHNQPQTLHDSAVDECVNNFIAFSSGQLRQIDRNTNMRPSLLTAAIKVLVSDTILGGSILAPVGMLTNFPALFLVNNLPMVVTKP